MFYFSGLISRPQFYIQNFFILCVYLTTIKMFVQRLLINWLCQVPSRTCMQFLFQMSPVWISCFCNQIRHHISDFWLEIMRSIFGSIFRIWCHRWLGLKVFLVCLDWPFKAIQEQNYLEKAMKAEYAVFKWIKVLYNPPYLLHWRRNQLLNHLWCNCKLVQIQEYNTHFHSTRGIIHLFPFRLRSQRLMFLGFFTVFPVLCVMTWNQNESTR